MPGDSSLVACAAVKLICTIADLSCYAQFRRSMKNESKHESAKPVTVSIPNKDAIAIEPPKKVCRPIKHYRRRLVSNRNVYIGNQSAV